jgi:hypothetical protein
MGDAELQHSAIRGHKNVKHTLCLGMETSYMATLSRTDIISKKSGEPKMMDVDQHLEEIGLGVLIMRNQSSTTLIYLFARTHHRQVSVH